MIVSELIEWLKTQPQDAIVEVLQHTSSNSPYMQGGECQTVDFTGQLNVDYNLTDFRENSFVKAHEKHYGKQYLLLGEYL